MTAAYRFHGPANPVADEEPVLLRKRSKRPAHRMHIIGVDPASITDQSGTRAIETYSPDDADWVTLTRREADLVALANPGIRSPVALEDAQPWLPECRYLNDSAASHRAAERTVRRFVSHFVTAASYCDERWATICNVLRRRSLHDARFYTAWHLPIQEAYVLQEERPDRSVVAIDFNGMYPACMQQSFPRPSDLRLVRIDRDHVPGEHLLAGLYRCILDGPTSDFIVQHNPFRSFGYGRHLRTSLDEPIEVDLNEFEVDFFQRHFQHVRLVEAVVSDRVVPHPLAKEVGRAFARRRSYRAQGNKALADREKYLATLMTSCANRPARPTRRFDDLEGALSEARSLYGIRIPPDEPAAATGIWMDGRKGVTLQQRIDGVTMQGPALRDGSACHLLGQCIVARGRIVLLEMMESILASAPDVAICYANIDSIHFSVPTVHLDSIMTWLASEASEAMGSFKIEAVAKHGLWLEPGRYWLYSENEVRKYRNRSVGDREQPFRDHAIHVANRQIGDLHVPIRATLRMERTMTPSRSLDAKTEDGLRRQHLIEVGAATIFTDVLDRLERNQRTAIPERMKAFERLEKKMASGNAASVPEEKTIVG